MNLSIKNIPQEMLEKLRDRARRHHRSLQGEVMTILEDAIAPQKLSVDEVCEQVKRLGLSTGDESTAWIRELRDSR